MAASLVLVVYRIIPLPVLPNPPSFVVAAAALLRYPEAHRYLGDCAVHGVCAELGPQATAGSVDPPCYRMGTKVIDGNKPS